MYGKEEVLSTFNRKINTRNKAVDSEDYVRFHSSKYNHEKGSGYPCNRFCIFSRRLKASRFTFRQKIVIT